MNNQISFFDREPVAHARHTDVETSHAAAESVKNIRKSQDYVLRLLSLYGPMTDEQLLLTIDPGYPISPSGVRTRRSELVSLGLVRFTGRKVAMKTGRLARVWEVV